MLKGSQRSRTRRRSISWGDLRRGSPIARNFGLSEGLPVDRVYIEAFLERNALAIRSRVLEVGDGVYTARFGGDKVTSSDVLHVTPGHPGATITADLADADHLPSDTFDCIICTQTLQLIFDLPAAVATLYRILKPGGALLLTVPGISQTDDLAWAPTWYWSFTPLAVQTLLSRRFGSSTLEVEGHGNVLASVAFLHGIPAEDLERRELTDRDSAYPLLVTARAVKPPVAASIAVPISALASTAGVAIIICCFNQAHFLGDAIESALAQSVRADEIVVIDDGSFDNTEEIARRYDRVKYVQQGHAGLATARNTGLASSQSEYVIFLDADDRLRPQAIAAGLSLLAARPHCACVSGHHRLIDIDGNLLHESARPPLQEDRYAMLLRSNYIGMCGAVMFRRAALRAVGGFDPTLTAAEDYDLYLRLARRFPGADHGIVVAEYRRYGESITDQPMRMLRAVLQVLKAQKPFAVDHPVYAQAWRAGMHYWQSYYGVRSVEEITRRLEHKRGLLSVLRDAFGLARLAPASFKHAATELVWRGW